jgi:hypothetical protein
VSVAPPGAASSSGTKASRPERVTIASGAKGASFGAIYLLSGKKRIFYVGQADVGYGPDADILSGLQFREECFGLAQVGSTKPFGERIIEAAQHFARVGPVTMPRMQAR